MCQSALHTVYSVLSKELTVGSQYPFSRLGIVMSQQGYTPKQFDKKKWSQVMAEMSAFLDIAPDPSTLNAFLGTLREWPDFDASQVIAPEKEVAVAKPAEEPVPVEEPAPTEEPAPVEEPAPAEEPTPESKENVYVPTLDELPTEIVEQIFLLPKSLARLNLLATGSEDSPAPELIQALINGYATARAKGKVTIKPSGACIFPTGILTDGKHHEITCGFRKNKEVNNRFPWVLLSVGTIPLSKSELTADQPTPAEMPQMEVSSLAAGVAVAAKAAEPVDVETLVMPLDDDDRKNIYDFLLEQFVTEEEYHMAKVSKALNDGGFQKERFNYHKMRDMMDDLSEFLSTREELINGVPQVMITLHRSEKYSNYVITPEVPDTSESAADELPEHMDGLIDLPSKTLILLNKFVTGREVTPPEDMVKTLCEDYDAARASQAFSRYKDSFVFNSRLTSPEGIPIYAAVRRSDRAAGLPWYLSFVGLKEKPMYGRVAPGKELERFAFLGDWSDFLETLAKMALPELWDFKASNDGVPQYAILRSYIQYTFYRLQLEDKVCIHTDMSGREDFAAFDTGLVTKHYHNIYACFEPNIEGQGSPWRFVAFCEEGIRRYGKKLIQCFNPVPRRASYLEQKEHLLFDLEKDLYVDYDHIILDNLPRLPIPFLKDACRWSSEALSLLQQIEAVPVWLQKKSPLYDNLRTIIRDDEDIFNEIQDDISAAINLARDQVRWNYKTAIPCYFPAGNSMSQMLPLCLQRDDTADVALVVELMESGNYQGQTILTLEMAYVDARLLCRPNSEWLDNSKIVSEEDEEDE
ncbi:MAG: DUF3825 domain-containing protein [Firmicutes bacterium]|nr:DUF3825 domain-containing protein [Bacillota bacterium]